MKTFYRISYWSSRILSVLFFLIMVPFFNGDPSYNEKPKTFSMDGFIFQHPLIILIIIMLISWKWELMGGFLYLFLFISFIILFLYNNPHDTLFISLSLVLILISILFTIQHFIKKRID
jgi:hypothetical protein